MLRVLQIALRMLVSHVSGLQKLQLCLKAQKNLLVIFANVITSPNTGYAPFDNADQAITYIQSRYKDKGCVVKADGLAAGKGVIVADNQDQAIEAVRMILDDGQFGASGAHVVIEDRIEGIEASLFALTDGKTALMIGSAQDHKRAYDGDKGPNTGGMGAISPAPALTQELEQKAWNEIVVPVIKGMAEEGNPYKGFLYAGLMLTATGPQVIEFNCRFGDPEAEVILPRLQSDLLKLMNDAAANKLEDQKLEFDDNIAITVIIANGGYPGSYEKGGVITGLDEVDDVTVFHAGTTKKDGHITASGGRVLAVTSLGKPVKSHVIKHIKPLTRSNGPDVLAELTLPLLKN